MITEKQAKELIECLPNWCFQLDDSKEVILRYWQKQHLIEKSALEKARACFDKRIDCNGSIMFIDALTAAKEMKDLYEKAIKELKE